MKITLSQSQWLLIGQKTGWMKSASGGAVQESLGMMVKIIQYLKTKYPKEFQEANSMVKQSNGQPNKLAQMLKTNPNFLLEIMREINSQSTQSIKSKNPAKPPSLAPSKSITKIPAVASVASVTSVTSVTSVNNFNLLKSASFSSISSISSILSKYAKLIGITPLIAILIFITNYK